MRLRHSLAAALGAVALIVTLPASAHATEGDFLYTGPLGKAHKLTDPASGECINLPEPVNALLPAHSPQNKTTATATVYLKQDCEGTSTVMTPGQMLGSSTKFRSVLFD
ncbi:hypothetical protein [Streptomyces sp. cg36]|uniref:hypothetical protein n=1 Tax=Streptomyces sp. cg36 TaxID=3238798 RepID=UPI0034E1C0F2